MMEKECEQPCPPDDPCSNCEEYWKRMKRESFWIDGKGWTDKAIKEMIKP